MQTIEVSRQKASDKVDSEFWHKRWRDSQLGFHQQDYNSNLIELWPKLNLPPGSTVFVPLCGKSRDMIWLAEQGHCIVGVELSQIAIDDFFKDVALTPAVRTAGGFTIKSAGPYELWCGDAFEFPSSALDNMSAIYDRAALIALPQDARRKYAQAMATLNRSNATYFLIGLEYDQSIMDGPPFSVTKEEVTSLFADTWHIEVRSHREVEAKSPKFRANGITRVIEGVYLLQLK